MRLQYMQKIRDQDIFLEISTCACAAAFTCLSSSNFTYYPYVLNYLLPEQGEQ